MTDDNDDKTVKQLIDAGTRADLERWFGLPSFEQQAEQKAKEPEVDAAMQAVIERQAKALEAIDPNMVEWHRRRVEPPADLLKFTPSLELRVDPELAFLDHSMIDKGFTIAEPREVEIPEPLREDLKACTPQALLRDLHRPEIYFDKVYEVDTSAVERINPVNTVGEVMNAEYRFTTAPVSLAREGRDILRELRSNRLYKWTPDELAKLSNRRVSES